MTLEQHPLSAAFPTMPKMQFSELVEDIKRNGQREPGVLYEGKVLDGWHRYRACEEARVPFSHKELADDDPLKFVLSKNLHRRHLTKSQRAAAIVACQQWAPACRPKKDAATAPLATVDDMAKQAEVSPRTIQQAKKAHEAGLGEAVKEGKLTAERAAKLADLADEERARALQAGDTPPRKPSREDQPALRDLIARLEAELRDTRASRDELADIAKAADAFKHNDEFNRLRALQIELATVKTRRDDLMSENEQLKRQLKYWKQRAEQAEKRDDKQVKEPA